MLSDATN